MPNLDSRSFILKLHLIPISQFFTDVSFITLTILTASENESCSVTIDVRPKV